MNTIEITQHYAGEKKTQTFYVKNLADAKQLLRTRFGFGNHTYTTAIYRNSNGFFKVLEA